MKYASLFLSSFTLSILHALMANTCAKSNVLYCYSSVSSWCAPTSLFCSGSICETSKTPISCEVETYLPIHCCLTRLWWMICEMTRLIIFFLSLLLVRFLYWLTQLLLYAHTLKLQFAYFTTVKSFHYSVLHAQKLVPEALQVQHNGHP